MNRLVEEAGEMAKLEAGEFHLNLEPTPISDIIQAALNHCKAALAGRPVNVQVSPDLPPVRADLDVRKRRWSN